MGFIVEQWETPPVSLTLSHLPFQGRQGRFAPGRVPHS